MESILFFLTRLEKGERPDMALNAERYKQGSIWYYFYNDFCITRLGIKPMTACLLRECFTTEPTMQLHNTN